MLLRAAHRLVKDELTRPAPTLPVTGSTRNLSGVIPNGVQPAHLPADPAAPGNPSRDNVDPYLLSGDYNNPAGMTIIYALYGKQEGGVGSKYVRLPSLKSGTAPAKGLYAIIMSDLGVVLVTGSKENLANRTIFWHSVLQFGHHEVWGTLGTDQ
jgi:hypothetical protein